MVKYVFYFLFLINSVFSQDIFTASTPKKAPLPDPLELQSNWWEYFDEDETEFVQKKTAFIQKLNAIAQSVDLTHRFEIENKIKIINEALTLLSQINKPVLFIPAKEENYLSEYHLEDLEKFANNLYDLGKKISSEKKQIDREKNLLDRKEKFIDNLWLSYKALPQNSLQKLLGGLEIIENQIYWRIEKLKFQELSIALQKNQSKVEHIHEEIEYIRKHLIVKKEISNKNTEELLTKEKKNIHTIQIALYEKDLPLDQKRLMKQKLLISNISSFIYQTELLKEQILDNFFQPDKKNIKLIHDKIKIANKKLVEIKNYQSSLQSDQQFYYEDLLNDTEAKQQLWYSESVKLTESSHLLMKQLDRNLFVTEFLLQQFNLYIKEKHTTTWNRIVIYWHQSIAFIKKHASWFESSLFKIGNHPITPLAIFKFFFILIIAYLFAKITRRSLRKFGDKHQKISQSGFYTLSKLAFYTIIFIGFIIAFISLGIDLTAFAVIAGALSLGIGFGLQSIFINFIAGIVLLLEKKVRIGDFVQLESQDLGTIKEINVRTTLIKTLDNLEILVPNSELVSKKFINWTLTEKIRRIRVPFGVAFGSDKELVKNVVVEAAKKVSTTLRKIEPDVWLMEIGESSLNFQLIVWVDEYKEGLKVYATKARYLWAIETALKEHNIQIPFPVRDVHITKQVHNEK